MKSHGPKLDLFISSYRSLYRYRVRAPIYVIRTRIAFKKANERLSWHLTRCAISTKEVQHIKFIYTTQNLLRITFSTSCQHSPSRSIFKCLAHLCWPFIHAFSVKVSSFSLFPFSKTWVRVWLTLKLGRIVRPLLVRSDRTKSQK